MKVFNSDNIEIEVQCPCGSGNFTFDSVGQWQGLVCVNCKVFRTIKQLQQHQRKETSQDVSICIECVHNLFDDSSIRICRKFSQINNRRVTCFEAKHTEVMCNHGEHFESIISKKLFEKEVNVL